MPGLPQVQVSHQQQDPTHRLLLVHREVGYLQTRLRPPTWRGVESVMPAVGAETQTRRTGTTREAYAWHGCERMPTAATGPPKLHSHPQRVVQMCALRSLIETTARGCWLRERTTKARYAVK